MKKKMMLGVLLMAISSTVFADFIANGSSPIKVSATVIQGGLEVYGDNEGTNILLDFGVIVTGEEAEAETPLYVKNATGANLVVGNGSGVMFEFADASIDMKAMKADEATDELVATFESIGDDSTNINEGKVKDYTIVAKIASGHDVMADGTESVKFEGFNVIIVTFDGDDVY